MNRLMTTGATRAALTRIVLLATFVTRPSRGDDPATASAQTAVDTAAPGTKRVLIVCGLSGDAAHHKLFSESVSKLCEGLTQQLGFSADNVQVLFGDPVQVPDSKVLQSAKRATREELEKSVADLREKLRPEDALWVIVLGHSHYDGKHSWLNLPGPDIQQLDFGKLFADITAREQVFFITTPTSGFFVKPLSAKGRVVITATEVDWETNETEFPHELARVLSVPPKAKEFDIDQDGASTLFDLNVAVVRNLAQSYLERELLATEHPLLDDNGDGRGTEVQIDYLTVEQGGRAKPNKPLANTLKPNSDGSLSKSIRFPIRTLARPPRPHRPEQRWDARADRTSHRDQRARFVQSS